MTNKHWNEASKNNAARGFPFHTWGQRKDKDCSLVLLASHATKEQAEGFACVARVGLRPHEYLACVCLQLTAQSCARILSYVETWR